MFEVLHLHPAACDSVSFTARAIVENGSLVLRIMKSSVIESLVSSMAKP